jgi:hypothetical protein
MWHIISVQFQMPYIDSYCLLQMSFHAELKGHWKEHKSSVRDAKQYMIYGNLGFWDEITQ